MNYVFDIDGTLSFDGQTIKHNIIDQLTKIRRADNRIIFASARPIRDTLPIIPDWPDVSIIGANGAILRHQSQIKVVQPISIATAKVLNELISEYDLDYVIDSSWDYAVHVSSKNFILKQLDTDNLARQIDRQQIIQPLKVILLNLSGQQFAAVQSKLKSYNDLNMIEHSGEHNIDITARGINKYTTLQTIIGQQPYIAFGNDSNDIELLKHAQTGYWLGSTQLAKQLSLPQVVEIANNSAAIANLLARL